jgi:Flp pilus assembly protein TadB
MNTILTVVIVMALVYLLLNYAAWRAREQERERFRRIEELRTKGRLWIYSPPLRLRRPPLPEQLCIRGTPTRLYSPREVDYIRYRN